MSSLVTSASVWTNDDNNNNTRKRQSTMRKTIKLRSEQSDSGNYDETTPELEKYGKMTPQTIDDQKKYNDNRNIRINDLLNKMTSVDNNNNNDAMGDFLINDLDQFGISHTAKRITSAKTGMVVVLVDKSGERTMFPDSGANSGLGVSDLPELTGFKLAFISAYALINPVSRNGVLEIIKVLRSKNIKVFIDPASVGALQSIAKPEINSWLAQANFLIMNFDEAKFDNLLLWKFKVKA